MAENVVVDGGTVRFTPSGSFVLTGTATATLSADSGTEVQMKTSPSSSANKAILSNHQWTSVVSNEVGYTIPSTGHTLAGKGTFRASSISSGIATNMKSGSTSVILESASGSATFTVNPTFPAKIPGSPPTPDTVLTKSGNWSVIDNGQGTVKLKSD